MGRFEKMKAIKPIVLMVSAGVVCSAPWAAAPLGQYTIMADAGLVKDNKANLTWQRAHSDGGMAWAEADAYCTALRLGSPSSGWRVPKKLELESLVDRGRANPAIDPDAFPETPPAAFFWTSTPVGGGPSHAWVVEFGPGDSNGYRVENPYWVRCVR